MITHTRFVYAAAIAAAALLGALVFVTTTFAQPGPYFQVGQAIASAQRPGAAPPLVAIVDGRQVTESDIQTYQALAQLNNAASPRQMDVGRKAAFAAVTRAIATSQRAATMGARPSDGDIDQYVAAVRQSFQGNRAGQQLDDYVAGLGRTRDAFFADPSTRAAYGRALTTARLRAQITAGMSVDQAYDAWKKYEDDAVAQAHITIIDPTLR